MNLFEKLNTAEAALETARSQADSNNDGITFDAADKALMAIQAEPESFSVVIRGFKSMTHAREFADWYKQYGAENFADALEDQGKYTDDRVWQVDYERQTNSDAHYDIHKDGVCIPLK
jgi:hypothetical protein